MTITEGKVEYLLIQGTRMISGTLVPNSQFVLFSHIAYSPTNAETRHTIKFDERSRALIDGITNFRDSTAE